MGNGAADQTPKPRVPLDRWFWLAMVISACVLIPRAVSIMRAHSEYLDDPAHVRRGLALLSRNPGNLSIMLTDPPGGGALEVLPIWLAGCSLQEPIVVEHWPGGKAAWDAARSPDEKVEWRQRVARMEVYYGHRLSPEAIFMIIGVWKAILYLPFAGLIFYACRLLYGLAAGWLGLAMVLFEPNFVAHISTGALDVMAIEAIAFACFFTWRYFETPSIKRLIVATLFIGLAMAIKHTAIVLPAVVLIYAGLWWWKSRADLKTAVTWRHLPLGAVMVLLWIWAFCWFDISRPREFCWPMEVTKSRSFSISRDVLDPMLDWRLPGGMYIGSFIGAIKHSRLGHWSYLLGQHSHTGWWYYFPVVATYKVPIGIALVLLLGTLSFIWKKLRWEEVWLVVPLIVWTALMIFTKVNIGFRHFLPAYLFMMLLATRCVAGAKMWVKVITWLGVAAAAIHGVAYHPDYIAYFNWPRHKPYLAINDSNVDWGQSLKQVRTWLDEHPQNRPVWLGNFWDHRAPGIKYFLGDRVIPLTRTGPRPTSGLLIISPAWEAGLYDWYDAYGALRAWEPMDVIGHNMLVYDLDEMFKRGFKWGDSSQAIDMQVPQP